MTRKIFCCYLETYDIGLDQPPYPGELGKKIYKTISKIAWKTWMSQQTKLINEKKLNMLDINDRKILKHYMIQFLFNKKRHK
ncbi:MAG: oxidative damage protection protein [Buchnera aphidicola (Floraphis choui)]